MRKQKSGRIEFVEESLEHIFTEFVQDHEQYFIGLLRLNKIVAGDESAGFAVSRPL